MPDDPSIVSPFLPVSEPIMILDQLENGRIYSASPVWKKAFDFLDTLANSCSDGRYDIEGDDVFALIMSYQTRLPDGAQFEAHRNYLDIQVMLSGFEICEWSPVTGLSVKVPYDREKDAEFYDRLQPGTARIELVPGMFVAFFPGDAHLPTLISGAEPVAVKKAVVKIRLDRLAVKI